jgi:hypothetical protein
MVKNLWLVVMGVAFALAVGLAPSDASAANCNFNRNEKISMVSWVIPLAGAVMTPLACKRDLFSKKGTSAVALPPERRDQADARVLDRRRRRGL